MEDPKGRFVLTAALVAMVIVSPADSAVVNVTQGFISADNPVVQARASGAELVDDVVNLIYQSCIFPEDYLALRRLAYVESKDGTAAGTQNIWGVTQAMFDVTRNTSNPTLQAPLEQIQKAFGIHWASVQYSDLQKPLYSALAALLYVTTKQIPVPSSSEEQGAFWQSNYPSSASSTNYTRSIEAWKGACNGSDQQADIVFVLDATTSIENFRRMLEYVKSVVQGLDLGSSFIRVALYQFGSSSSLRCEFRFDAFGNHNEIILQAIQSTSQMTGDTTLAPDTGYHLQAILRDSLTTSGRQTAAKILVLITDSKPADHAAMLRARDQARMLGVSVITVGIRSLVSLEDLVTIATQPVCTHQMEVATFQHLKDLVELTQFRLCKEPMIALGMIHCFVTQCRNIAFSRTSPEVTIIASTTCDRGNVYISTRTPTPSMYFADAQIAALPESQGASYVSIFDNSFFVYADFQLASIHLNCYVTINAVNGIRPSINTTTSTPGTSLQFPTTNPCLEPGRIHDRYPYPYSTNVFIQCDLQNTMYLTMCPTDKPFFSRDCRYCVGPDSPILSGCVNPEPDNSDFCGLLANPCTAANINSNHYFFSCPLDERRYVQCDQWGKAYIKTCPSNEVWRQTALTCEFLPVSVNPCNGINRFFAYSLDPNAYIMCDNNLIPFLMHCQVNFRWDQADQTCVPQTWIDHTELFTRQPEIVTAPVTTTLPPSAVTADLNGLLSVNFADPCNDQNLLSHKLFFQYPYDSTKYIECDLYGNGFLKSCQAGYYFSSVSGICVSGPIIPVGRK